MVFLAMLKSTNEKVALKQINLEIQKKKDLILLEIKVMRALNHPNLINLKEVGRFSKSHQ